MHDHVLQEVREWDERYTGDGSGASMWSGRPNGALTEEVAGLPPGTALDVGCGEGADAIWLALRGWRVTAVDPSGVALERAGSSARAAHADVTWVRSGLLGMPGGTGTYDLVSAQYPVLRRTDDDAAILALLAAVAPGGTLLFVHHELEPAHAAEHGFDPTAHVMPADVAARLDDGWTLEVHATRPRRGALPPDARHIRDVILRARRHPRADVPCSGAFPEGHGAKRAPAHGSRHGLPPRE